MNGQARWETIRELFEQAKGMTPAERAVFLSDSADPDVRHEVEELILSHERAGAFMEAPAPVSDEVICQVAEAVHKDLQVDPIVGAELDGRYRVEKIIGEGGFGRVYFARDRALDSCPVVVKVLSKPVKGDPWRERRFTEEIQSMARIDHPGVVRVLDHGVVADGRSYLVLQYVPGESLRQSLNSGPLELARVVRLTTQIAEALNAAHQAGICHRDLKPENIQIREPRTDTERAIILDFGIARIMGDDEASGNSTVIAGSPAYMAPEQRMGKAVPASDIYALGLIVYEMLSGEKLRQDGAVPFPEKSIEQRLADKRTDLPIAARKAIAKAASPDAAQRFSSANEFGRTFVAALAVNRRPRYQWVWAAAAILAILGFYGWARSTKPPLLLNCSVQEDSVILEPSDAGYLYVIGLGTQGHHVMFPQRNQSAKVEPNQPVKLEASYERIAILLRERPSTQIEELLKNSEVNPDQLKSVLSAVRPNGRSDLMDDGTRRISLRGTADGLTGELRLSPAVFYDTQFRRRRASSATDPAHGLIGITLWKLRPSTSGDVARILTHRPESSMEYTPERMGANTLLRPEDKVRITVESGIEGHLYVVSRERYQDGSEGTPYLVFPSSRIQNGDNRVRPGRLVDIPEASNRVPYLSLDRRRSDQVSEVVIAIVAPKEIPGWMVKGDELKALDAQQVDRWVKSAAGETETIDLETASRGAWTEHEKASAAGGQLLNPKDAVPQRLYRMRRRSNDIPLATISLRLAL